MVNDNLAKRQARGKRSDPPRSMLQSSAVHLLHRAGQCAEEIFTSEFSKWDLTPRQFAVLVAAHENEGGSQTDIVARTGIDRSTLADLVRRLVKKGLLQRRRTREDARAYAVRPTEQGRQIIEASGDVARRVESMVLAGLSVSDRDRLIGLLSGLVTHLRPEDPMARL